MRRLDADFVWLFQCYSVDLYSHKSQNTAFGPRNLKFVKHLVLISAIDFRILPFSIICCVCFHSSSFLSSPRLFSLVLIFKQCLTEWQGKEFEFEKRRRLFNDLTDPLNGPPKLTPLNGGCRISKTNSGFVDTIQSLFEFWWVLIFRTSFVDILSHNLKFSKKVVKFQKNWILNRANSESLYIHSLLVFSLL